MRLNRIKELWQAGQPVFNTWMSIGNSFAAEILAHQGWDSITVDLQHGPIGFDAAVPMLQAIGTTATVPIARVNWNEPGQIMRLLDAGAYGIICPMTNTRAQAEAFVRACRYAPTGERSYGPTRVRYYAGEDYFAHANAEILTFAMIETQEAIDNLDAILSVPGLNALYVGPSDLYLSLYGTNRGLDNREEKFIAVLNQIVATAAKYNVVPGIHTGSSENARAMAALGFRFLTVMTDVTMLAHMSKQLLAEMRAT